MHIAAFGIAVVATVGGAACNRTYPVSVTTPVELDAQGLGEKGATDVNAVSTMKAPPPKKAITVAIVDVAETTDPISARLTYVVENRAPQPIWLVTDGWMVWHQEGDRIDISVARERMSEGAQVSGYYDPVVEEIGPGKAVKKTLTLKWPQPLDRLWNDTDLAAPHPGRYRIAIRVGFGTTPAPGPPELGEGVEPAVFRWQTTVTSDPVPIRIPPYPSGR